MFLDSILPVKREEVEYRRSRRPVKELKPRPGYVAGPGFLRRREEGKASRPGTG